MKVLSLGRWHKRGNLHTARRPGTGGNPHWADSSAISISAKEEPLLRRQTLLKQARCLLHTQNRLISA